MSNPTLYTRWFNLGEMIKRTIVVSSNLQKPGIMEYGKLIVPKPLRLPPMGKSLKGFFLFPYGKRQ